ncbi:hypothetical protein BOO69_01570 [Sulfitobacter alexandrii]|uniref:Response regulatory domain-containing protein n=1 Tax=Sulfitobacter alexandrii TaxID=1917485 RepID=A0A1J0WD47_9RHOB|nr:hypothetical protein [Sulfitobacter alexandrii]APE42247.1 hypothetical protein BOO69_01570 [Sulfitobacter alexandrii]
MNILIVESCAELGEIWKRHLERLGMDVVLRHGQQEAISYLSGNAPQIIILNLVLEEGSALAVADYASYRLPDARVICVTNTSFFSDGSIFAHIGNASTLVPMGTPPEDIAAMVEYYGTQTNGG